MYFNSWVIVTKSKKFHFYDEYTVIGLKFTTQIKNSIWQKITEISILGDEATYG